MKVLRSDDINPARSLVSLRQRSNSRNISFSNEGDVRKTKIERKKVISNLILKDGKIHTFIFYLCHDIENTYFYILLLQLWTYPQLSRKYKIPLHFFEDRQER